MRSPVMTVLQTHDSTTRVYSLTGDVVQGSVRPTFVLVHGIGMSHRYFRRLQAELAEVGDVHAIDLPGFGRNRRPRTDRGVQATALVLVAAIEALGIGPSVLVGHSMGAQFVIEASILRPDLVTHLILIAPVADPRRPRALRHALRMSANSALETPIVNAIQFSDYLRCGPIWYVDQAARMLSYPIRERLPLTASPVLVIRGARDVLAQKRWCTALGRIAQDGRTISIPRAAHVVQYSRPAAVRREIVAFAASARPGAR